MDITMLRALPVIAVVPLLLSPTYAGRDGGGYYSAQRVANLRANVEALRLAVPSGTAVKRAERWIAMSDEDHAAVDSRSDAPARH